MSSFPKPQGSFSYKGDWRIQISCIPLLSLLPLWKRRGKKKKPSFSSFCFLTCNAKIQECVIFLGNYFLFLNHSVNQEALFVLNFPLWYIRNSRKINLFLPFSLSPPPPTSLFPPEEGVKWLETIRKSQNIMTIVGTRESLRQTPQLLSHGW